jgi:transporter family-2 protein
MWTVRPVPRKEIGLEALAIPALLFVGTLLALQAAANVQLAAAMTSPVGASTLQLAIGAALLVALAAVGGSLGALAGLERAEPWQLLGGLGSRVYITAGILVLPRLGALVAVGLFIAGQMLASLLLDGFGWLGVDRDAPGVPSLFGAAAVIVGTWLIVRAQAGAEALEQAARERRGWIALALAAGAVLPVQGAVNRSSTPSSTPPSPSAPSRSWSQPRRWRSRSPP